ncbi:hypothetical protein SCARD494_10651 [Seiridium cardinale]
MIPAFLRSLSPLTRKWKPLTFCNTNFTRIPPNQKIEEETFPDYVASRYYPADIGETFVDRYQIVGKLGFGASSTVWLARDLSHRRHVVLKLYVNSNAMGKYLDDEINTYRRMERGSKQHPGYNAVRSLLDSFSVDGPDIKADNIMFGIQDDSVFEVFEEEELQNPSPRKVLTDRTVYASRALRTPKEWGAPVLCDFGSAVSGEGEHLEDIQPDIYRAPEVILQIPWTYSVDIWNIWDVFEGGHLFTGRDPESQTYRSRTHLAEMIALLGPPSPNFLARGGLSHKFFSPEGSSPAGFNMFPTNLSGCLGNFIAKVQFTDRGDWASGYLEYLPGLTVALITFSPVYASVILAIPDLVFNLFNYSFTTPRGGGEDHAGQVMDNVLAAQNTPAIDPDAQGTVKRDRQKVNHIDVVYSLLSEALGLRPQDFGVDYDES